MLSNHDKINKLEISSVRYKRSYMNLNAFQDTQQCFIKVYKVLFHFSKKKLIVVENMMRHQKLMSASPITLWIQRVMILVSSSVFHVL